MAKKKEDGFCGHPENAEALRKVLNKSAEVGLMMEGQQAANIPFVAIDEQAQRAALRQRVLDVAAGATGMIMDENNIINDFSESERCNFVLGLNHRFKSKIAENLLDGEMSIDSLAAWLWERGCR